MTKYAHSETTLGDIVVTDDGIRVAAAPRLRGGANAPERQFCTTCSYPFLSEGVHQRICGVCRDAAGRKVA